MKSLKRFFRPFNIFSILMIIAGFAFAFRLANILSFPHLSADTVGVVMPAGAQEAAPNENPPPLTKEELQKAVDETAKKADELGADAEPAPAATKRDQPIPPPPDDADVHAYTAAEVEVLQSLSKRRDELEKRERALADREALSDAAGQEIDRKIAELNKLKGEIEALLGKQQKMEEDRLVSLVKIYENMKPKEAATIFNTLDLDVLLAVIGRMNERKASPILANMDPEKARVVTIRLSEQRKLPKAGAPDNPADAAPAP